MSRISVAIRHFDWWLLVPAAYLVVLSFVVQYSILLKTTGTSIDYSLNSHVAALIASLGIAIFATYFRPINWLKAFWVVYALSLVALIVLVLTGGNDVARWLNIGGFQFQPTEIIKLATIGVLAGFVAKKAVADPGLKTVFGSLVIVGVPAILIALQPALGSALVFGFIWVLVMIASPVKFSRLGVIGLVVFMVFLFALPLLKPYQQERISSYLNPAEDSQGTSYNSIQAGIAIGSGGLIGKGLDSGTQSQLNFLPAQHTDFAFSVTAEKLGLIGAVSIIIALAVLMMRMVYLAWTTSNMYWRLLLIGIVAMFLCHSLVNIGMNVGILPVTGLPLPFISYGGTYLFICTTSVFLAMVVSYYIQKEQENA